MTFPSEHDFALFLFQLFILLSAALTLGSFLRRLGQAAVVGEIFAGVLLGPSILGALAPKLALGYGWKGALAKKALAKNDRGFEREGIAE